MDSRPTLSTRERARLFTLHGGRCHLCGERIDGVRERWEVEHVLSRAMLCGKLADTDENMRPAHYACHKRKTAQDAGDLAKAKRREAIHTGAKQRTGFQTNRSGPYRKRMDGSVVRRHP